MSAYANTDPKTTVMKQIQQEAAMQNAKMLVEVCRFHFYSSSRPSVILQMIFVSTLYLVRLFPDVLCRNSMSIASKSAFQHQAPLSPRLKKSASRCACRNTCPHGMSSQHHTSRKYRRRQAMGRLGLGFFRRAKMRRILNDLSGGFGVLGSTCSTTGVHTNGGVKLGDLSRDGVLLRL
jgi:hypothetical protein